MAQLNDGRQSVDVSVNKTLSATDQGIVQNIVVDGLTITLPATAAGLEYSFRNGGVPVVGTPYGTGFDGGLGFTVAPQAADAVAGLNFVATVAKGAVNTKLTSTVGDEIRVQASGVTGVTAWNVQSAKGIFARVA